MIKKILGKVCVLYRKHEFPDGIKGLYNIIDIDGNIYTQSASRVSNGPITEKPRWHPLWEI
jgi:hypothetical protein